MDGASTEGTVKAKELRESTDERLAELERNLRREIFEARIKNFTNQLDDTASIHRAKRDLARVLTIRSARAATVSDAGGGTQSHG
jgi:large subunit ribosomal protein L29